MSHPQPKYRRVVLKLSGEALAGPKGFGLDIGVLTRISEELKEIHALGVQTCIVVGGGTSGEGVRSAQGMDRSTADCMACWLR